MTFLGSCAKGRWSVVKEPLRLSLLFFTFLFPSDKKARRAKVNEEETKINHSWIRTLDRLLNKQGRKTTSKIYQNFLDKLQHTSPLTYSRHAL